MITKRQSLLAGLVIGLSLIVLSIPVKAQDRYQVRNMAQNLNNESNEAWNAIRNSRDQLDWDNPTTRQLFQSMRDFQNRARYFAQDAQGWRQPEQLRGEARRLVNQAQRIDDLMYRANVPDWVRHEWSEVDNSIQTVADFYNFPYQPERGLARRDWDDHHRYQQGY